MTACMFGCMRNRMFIYAVGTSGNAFLHSLSVWCLGMPLSEVLQCLCCFVYFAACLMVCDGIQALSQM